MRDRVDRRRIGRMMLWPSLLAVKMPRPAMGAKEQGQDLHQCFALRKLTVKVLENFGRILIHAFQL